MWGPGKAGGEMSLRSVPTWKGLGVEAEVFLSSLSVWRWESCERVETQMQRCPRKCGQIWRTKTQHGRQTSQMPPTGSACFWLLGPPSWSQPAKGLTLGFETTQQVRAHERASQAPLLWAAVFTGTLVERSLLSMWVSATNGLCSVVGTCPIHQARGPSWSPFQPSAVTSYLPPRWRKSSPNVELELYIFLSPSFDRLRVGILLKPRLQKIGSKK